jgi:hypothetical protein
MQIKTQKQVMALQNEAQKVADKLTEEVILYTKCVQTTTSNYKGCNYNGNYNSYI